jgi:hypothetical protein
MTIYKLDYHQAYKTSAGTWWFVVDSRENLFGVIDAVKMGLLKLVYSTKRPGKTHWYRYVKVLQPEKIKFFIRERESNRGNVYRQKFTLEEMKQFIANPEEIPIEKVE